MKKDCNDAQLGAKDVLLIKLVEKWFYDLEENEEFYFKVLIPKFQTGDFSAASNDEKEILYELKNTMDNKEFGKLNYTLRDKFEEYKREREKQALLVTFEGLLKNHDFKKAQALVKNTEKSAIFDIIYQKYLKEFKIQVKNEILYEITNGKITKAKNIFYNRIKYADSQTQLELGEFFEDRIELDNKLSGWKFKEADEFYKHITDSKKEDIIEEYEKMKTKYILKYYNDDFTIDYEKAYALSKMSRATLLKARAGSGKTTTLCLRTRFLAEKYDIDTDNILLLAFNKKAAAKLKFDLNENYGLDGFENARTFHSFARSIYKEKKNIEDIDKKKFVANAIDEILSQEHYKEIFYGFYKESIEPNKTHGYNLSNSEYVEFQRSATQVTLKGETVKSAGEKYIADFLFEHNIDYTYEKVIFFEKDEKNELKIESGWDSYKPDFCIRNEDSEYYWEHWAIGYDKNDKTSIIKDPEKYLDNADIKRKFWEKRNIPLIETWARDSLVSREYFEKIIKQKLTELGFELKKLSKEELYEKTKDLNKNKFLNTVTTFMTQIKKNEISDSYIKEKIVDKNFSKRTGFFLDIAYQVFLKYENYLKENELIDFDDLIKEATKRIIQTKGNCTYHVGGGIQQPVKSIKYLMVDEFQDFSKLFFKFIKAIEKFSPKMNIFCVGDDWQAINGFAGSDLHFFRNFCNLFKDASLCELLINYRSKAQIINVSNRLMEGEGPNATGVAENVGGEAYVVDADKTFFSIHNSSDLAFKFPTDTPLNIKAKYLKTAHRIIRLNQDKSVFILSRINRVHRADLSKDFLKSLKRLRTVDSKLINAASIHQSKGLEADVVIIFQAVNGVLPLIHPDYEINIALGKSLKEIMDEEKRLLYVALTRAREKIYILSESNKESIYLTLLDLKKMPFKKLTMEGYKKPTAEMKALSNSQNSN